MFTQTVLQYIYRKTFSATLLNNRANSFTRNFRDYANNEMNFSIYYVCNYTINNHTDVQRTVDDRNSFLQFDDDTTNSLHFFTWLTIFETCSTRYTNAK